MNSKQKVALDALAGMAGSPIVKLALKYWWLSIPTGLALYGKYKARASKDDYKIYHFFDDVGTVLGPIMTFVGLNELATKMEDKGKLDISNAKEAEYSVVQDQEAQS